MCHSKVELLELEDVSNIPVLNINLIEIEIFLLHIRFHWNLKRIILYLIIKKNNENIVLVSLCSIFDAKCSKELIRLFYPAFSNRPKKGLKVSLISIYLTFFFAPDFILLLLLLVLNTTILSLNVLVIQVPR